jgi:hypothetical protein
VLKKQLPGVQNPHAMAKSVHGLLSAEDKDKHSVKSIDKVLRMTVTHHKLLTPNVLTVVLALEDVLEIASAHQQLLS